MRCMRVSPLQVVELQPGTEWSAMDAQKVETRLYPPRIK